MTTDGSPTTSEDGSSLPTSTLEMTMESILTKETSEIRDGRDDIELVTLYAELQSPRQSLANDLDMGLEIIDQGRTPMSKTHQENANESRTGPPPPPPLTQISSSVLISQTCSQPGRTFPVSNFFKEMGVLLVVFILCMILVLAIREDQDDLRITMQIVYIYIYLTSTVWMIWCAIDIIKYRKQWSQLTSTVNDQEEYMEIVHQHPQNIFYFPDMSNTAGLFMRFGAGFLCMGSLLLTVIELAQTLETVRTGPIVHQRFSATYSSPVYIVKAITFLLRFFFHCIQFLFLFRYGNIIINRYHGLAQVGLLHVIIANFCTWFEAIVIETLEELHKHPDNARAWATSKSLNETILTKAGSSSNDSSTILSILDQIESSLFVYLYPCLIEYSLISVTVFYLMWRNIGQTEKRSDVHFADRHIYSINCSRASRGLLVGGIMFLLTILTIIPDYVLQPESAIPITHVTELVLMFIATIIVCVAFSSTTKLNYDQHGHANVFDQILILVTTVGDFAYSFFGLFAAVLIKSYTIQIPRAVEVAISLVAILQTFLQSAFILDTLKRRLVTPDEIRNKPGREWITALLLINLTIWLHDSLSAKKVKLNPLQVEYYNLIAWSIVQAFTSPLAIFYRFHSSVCLADIWQDVYDPKRDHLTPTSSSALFHRQH